MRNRPSATVAVLLLAAATPHVHGFHGAARHRCGASHARVAATTSMATKNLNPAVTQLNKENFATELAAFDGLAIVKFFAPWCRTCRAIAPTYDRMVSKIAAENSDKEVRFFEVDFKESKALCLRERVFALPTVHFYSRSLGRVNRFTLSPANAASKLRRELDRYLGDSNHLQVLMELGSQPEGGDPIEPLVRWSQLVGLLQALSNAEEYLDSEEKNELGSLAELLETDPRRVQELQATFDWIDADGNGLIDADELASVASAVSIFAPPSEGGQHEQELYTTMLEAALTRAGMGTPLAADEDAAAAAAAAADAADAEKVVEEEEDDACLLAMRPFDFPTFVRLMTSRAVSEFRKPETELQPAFAALDADGDGSITLDELMTAMKAVSEALPERSGRDYAEETVRAFEALDVDKSGTLDYEEFVAVLSGSSPYAAAAAEADA